MLAACFTNWSSEKFSATNFRWSSWNFPSTKFQNWNFLHMYVAEHHSRNSSLNIKYWPRFLPIKAFVHSSLNLFARAIACVAGYIDKDPSESGRPHKKTTLRLEVASNWHCEWGLTVNNRAFQMAVFVSCAHHTPCYFCMVNFRLSGNFCEFNFFCRR